MPNQYDRKPQIYTVQEVLSQRVSPDIFRRDAKKDFDGDMINMNSLRYECFDVKGTKCVSCGIEGTRFYKERIRANDPYHFNLYAVDEDGTEVLMTKDHKRLVEQIT